jgi:PAS domain S-box-containing protein
MTDELPINPADSDTTPLRQRLELILDSIPDYAIFVLDPQRRVIEWNSGAARILGYAPEEILGRSADIVFTPEDRAARGPEIEQEQAVAHGRAEDERWHQRKNGERFYASGVLSVVRDREGTLLGFVKVMRDFTEQRAQQEQLARSEQRYRFLIESIKDYAIFTIDPTGRITSWTPAAERILGYQAAEAIGLSLHILFTAEDRERRVPDLELETAVTRGRVEAVGWRVRRDGTRFWGEETATAMYDAAGVLRGISKITRDITQRMMAEAERERLLNQATEANRIKDEFLSTISHELRTPLNAILGWTRMLREGGFDQSGTARALQTVERNALTQAQLVDDLLDVSRIITGKLKLQLQQVDLVDAVSAALEAMRPAAAAKGVRLHSELDPDAEVAFADPDRIAQIIWNLLSNAIKFTPSGGEVAIATARHPTDIELRVRDTGIGIPAAFLPFVFDRFRQADSSTTRVQSGLGLGLAIVRHLVELHGGTVSVESDGPGQGATFYVRLPVTTGDGDTTTLVPSLRAATAPPPQAPRPVLAGIRTLIVDDHDDARDLLASMVERAGGVAVTAASAREAREVLEHFTPEVLLLDIAMPEEDGYSLLRQIRASGPTLAQVPAIATTAYAAEPDRLRARDAGFNGHLGKPLDFERLIAAIHELVSVAEPNRDPTEPQETPD